jgi:hypothetical protein
MKMKSPHIEFEQLVDLAEKRLPAKRRGDALAHVSDCSRCTAQLAQIDKAISLMRTDALGDVPRDVLANAFNIFCASVAPAKLSVARRVLAALTFDSAHTAPAYGLRSAAIGATRQLLYNASEIDMDVRITSSDDAWIVSGQVLGECAGGGKVDLQGAGGTAHAALNELCEFTLPAVSSGSYTLRLHLTDIEIEIPGLELMN